MGLPETSPEPTVNDSFSLGLNDPTLLKTQCYINGLWSDAGSGETLKVLNPATGTPLASIPYAGQPETANAIQHAGKALPAWRALTAAERGRFLKRWHDLILEHKNDLARLMTLEQGKPLAEALGEITYGASFVEWFAEEAKRAYGEVIPSPAPNARYVVIKQAIGVCAAITPWNSPRP